MYESKEEQTHEKISAGQLTSEIFELIRDSFVCRAQCEGEEIKMTFLSGQTFRVAVSEQ